MAGALGRDVGAFPSTHTQCDRSGGRESDFAGIDMNCNVCVVHYIGIALFTHACARTQESKREKSRATREGKSDLVLSNHPLL